MSTATLNINRLVTVTLTPEGQAHLSEVIEREVASWRSTSERGHPHSSLNNGEPHEWQLWELMRVFGPGLHNGCARFFEGNEITLTPPRTAHPEPTEEAHDYLCWIAGNPEQTRVVRDAMGPETAARRYLIADLAVLRGMGTVGKDRAIHMVMVCREDMPAATKLSVEFTISVRPGT